MDGLLLINKPTDWTSHDVVAKLRSIIRTQAGKKVKVGHAGTLDPAATGLLIVLIGKYTKEAAQYSELDKTYETEITLGATSSTGDIEGKISRQKTVDRRPGKAEIEQVLKQFTGKIKQKPHIYSAVKVEGKRAYKLARKGQKVDLEPREVTVYSLRSTDYRYPKLCITARVSSGTYIRSLAEDIGEKLGTGAYLSALRRTQIGRYNIKDALSLENLDPKALQQHLQNRGRTAKI